MLWNVDSPADERVGQAVLVSHWEFEDGSRGGPGAPVDEGDIGSAGESPMPNARLLPNTYVLGKIC